MPTFILERDATVIGEYAIAANRITLGRAGDNTICIAHESISRYHAVVEKEGSRYTIVDNGSLNGVYVDGEKITRSPLADNTLVSVGLYHIRFRYGAEIPGPAAAPSSSAESVPDNDSRPTIAVPLPHPETCEPAADLEQLIGETAIAHPFANPKELARLLRRTNDPPIRMAPGAIAKVLRKLDLATPHQRIFAGL